MEMKRLDESLSKESLYKSKTGEAPCTIDTSKIKVSGSGNIQPAWDMDVCEECGAVFHGNLFCGTCRNVANTKYGLNLPPWPYPAESPCGPEAIQVFIRRLNKPIRRRSK